MHLIARIVIASVFSKIIFHHVVNKIFNKEYNKAGNILASGSWDESIKIWNVNTGKCIRTLTGHTGTVFALQLLANNTLASGSGDHSIKIWNVDNGECLIGELGVVVYLLLNDWERKWIGWSICMSLFVCVMVECLLLYQRWRHAQGGRARPLNASPTSDNQQIRRKIRDPATRRRRVQQVNSAQRSDNSSHRSVST